MAISYFDQTARHPGKAAEKAEMKKTEQYQELEKEYLFFPIAIETMGSWGQVGLKLSRSSKER